MHGYCVMIQSELELARSFHRRSTEKAPSTDTSCEMCRYKLGTNQCVAERKGESGASVRMKLGFTLMPLLNQETGP